MYLNCCSLGYSHQMHILLLGEFPGEGQSESITTAFFITAQTISCSITQSKLAGSCTELSPYQLILIIILSTYKICFNFKALFKQRGPNWVCPGVAAFDRRMVKNVLQTPFCNSLVFIFFHPDLKWFHSCFSILLDNMQPPQQLTTVMFSRGLESKPEQWLTSCIWITCRLKLNSLHFYSFFLAQDQKNATSLVLEWGGVAKFPISFPFSLSFWFCFPWKNTSTPHHTFKDLSGTA